MPIAYATSWTFAKLKNIALSVRDSVLASSVVAEEISFFLCGGASKEFSSLRYRLGEELCRIKSRFRYTVHYPESMFLELTMGHRRYDLLSLENLLADSVNAVVIPLQGPGTFTELGAFANHTQLRHKLVVIVPPQYRTDRSFINMGPLSLLKTSTDSKILYRAFEASSAKRLATDVAEAARNIAKKRPVRPSLLNPLSSREYYLSLIAVLEPVSKSTVMSLAEAMVCDEEKAAAAATAETVINGLISERRVSSHADALRVPPNSLDTLVESYRTIKRSEAFIATLGALRSEVLNLTLRGSIFKELQGVA